MNENRIDPVFLPAPGVPAAVSNFIFVSGKTGYVKFLIDYQGDFTYQDNARMAFAVANVRRAFILLRNLAEIKDLGQIVLTPIPGSFAVRRETLGEILQRQAKQLIEDLEKSLYLNNGCDYYEHCEY